MRSVPATVCALTVLNACTCGEPSVAPPSSPPLPVEFSVDPELKGLHVVVTDGVSSHGAAPAVPAATAAPMKAAETEALLARLPPLSDAHGDRQVFALRKGSRPPARTGEAVTVAFPPAPELPPPDVTEAGELSVLRYAPEGAVPVAPKLSVSFSQPMVAVTSQDDAAQTVPVTISPEPPGQWRWIGTKTVLFEPDPRFPMSTDYRVEIPAGTTSATGGALEEAKTWTFDTPITAIVDYAPSGDAVELEPNLFVSFNQRIDAGALWERLTLNSAGGEREVVPLTDAEIDEDEQLSRRVEAAEPGRWIAFRPAIPLQRATAYQVRIAAGPISDEGPKPTSTSLGFGFHTYQPLKVEGQQCGWRDGCAPGARWWVSFNNPLDVNAFRHTPVAISPDITDALHIYAGGSAIHLDGHKPGSRSYDVTIPAELTDRFGQTLGADQVVRFTVGKDQPHLSSTGSPMIVLDPQGPAQVRVHSTNHDRLRLRVYRVVPSDWERLADWYESHSRDVYHRADLPGIRLTDKVLAVGGEADAMVETAIDLAPFMEGGYGQLLVWVTPTRPPARPWQRQEVIHWVQKTDIGLTAFHDGPALQVWANALADGSTLSDVSVSLLGTEDATPIDANGMVEIPVVAPADLLVARRGQDLALLPQSNSFWRAGGWNRYRPGDHLTWYVFDDRGMYKPGETVTVKGWIRTFGAGPRGDISATDVRSVSYTASGPQGNEVAQGEASVTDLGGFDFSFLLPDDVNLGPASILLRAEGDGSTSHAFQIQAFRRPEFEVSSAVQPGHHVLGAHVHASVSARYYAGGGLPSAETAWSGYATPTQYIPPNRSDYAFGPWTPWWGGYHWEAPRSNGPGFQHVGTSDATGTHDIDIHLASLHPPRPMTLHLSASVVDVNRQQWSTNSTVLVHPADLYVGLRAERSFIDADGAFEVDAIVTDIDGELVAGTDISMVLAHREWGTDEDGVWGMQTTATLPCDRVSAQSAVQCRLEPGTPGQYELTARVVDGQGRPNESTLRLWVSGGAQPSVQGVDQDRVTLVPSAKDFAAGDVAEIFVQAPFAPAEGVLSFRRSGLLHSERFRMEEATATLKIPIEEGHVPNLFVQVDLVGSTERSAAETTDGRAPGRPAYATGVINLPVPPRQRALAVSVVPGVEALAPGASTEIAVTVTDARGDPVQGSEVVVAVVDESVLALSGYALADPLGIFYAHRPAGVTDYHQRSQVVLDPDATESGLGGLGTRGTGSGGGGYGDVRNGFPGNLHFASMDNQTPMDGAPEPEEEELEIEQSGHSAGEATGGAIALRTNFDALALFAPVLATQVDGRVVVPITVPDSLTRYRVMAVAVHGDQHFGKGESAITARHPVMVRPSLPRFLNFGDRAEMPVMVQNQTDAEISVEVAMRASNAVVLDELPADPRATDLSGRSSAGLRVSVGASDRVEVRFPVSADMAGTARFQVAVAAGDFADATELSLPVWTPATTEAFATYGEVDDGVMVQPVAAPKDVWTQFGGLEVTTSSTALQALTDALIYLSSYPFSCAEQISSRVLAIAALRDVLDAFDADGLPPAEELTLQVEKDLAQLARRQNYDGGFGFWRRGDPSWPYLSIHVAHAASRAEEKGYTLDPYMRQQMLAYLRNAETHIPASYRIRSRRTLIAYALYTRHRFGDADGTRARKLFAEAGVDGLALEAQGWLLEILAADGAAAEVAAIERHWMNQVSETAGAAHFVTSYDDDAAHVLLHSSRRVDGVLLEALVKVRPDNDLIPKLVRGLLGHRKRGRWGNTQENAFVLLGMDAYFARFESQTPDFVARAWLGEGFAGEHAFAGRTTERARIDIPMGLLTETTGSQDLILQKDGVGRLYYRVGMRYAPRDLQVEPADRGFTVERAYEAVDDPEEVTREDGIWYVKAGARVRVRVTMVATGRRHHVALVDPLPAGFEVMNPALKVTGALPADPSVNRGAYWWWHRTWYEHENLRDERVEAFTSLLWDGVHEYTYVARATTPGQYVVPPPKAEEMYSPETFGRGASTRVVVH